MKRLGIAPIVALGIALLVLPLGGCGDSGGETEATTTGAESRSGGAAEAGKSREGGSTESAEDEKTGQRDGGSAAKVRTSPLKVSGGGSSQYRVPGGDNSVQEFGEESDETELDEAATALHDYLVARAEEDWATACVNVSESVEEQLQELAARAKGLEGRGCAAVLGALTPKLPPSVRRESTIVDAGSLRLEGEQAFLIYRGAEGKTYTILMTPEDGAWKVGSLAATPLS